MPATIQEDTSAMRGQIFVLQTGLITTAATLFGVWWLSRNTEDVNIMGWYANYVIPAGALIVGLAAGSGYGLGSWFSGLKMNRSVLLTVIVLQICAYFAAQYIEFRQLDLVYRGTGKPVSFFSYFHEMAVSFAWKNRSGDGYGNPLGLWGYAFRGLEVVGFVAGGIIAPAILMAVPYCDSCKRYKKTKQLALIPASIPLINLKKADAKTVAEHEAAQNKALDEANTTLEQLKQFAAAGDANGFRAAIQVFAGDKKSISKLPRRLKVDLSHCVGCHQGELRPSLITGSGEKSTTEKLPPVPASVEFVQGILGNAQAVASD